MLGIRKRSRVQKSSVVVALTMLAGWAMTTVGLQAQEPPAAGGLVKDGNPPGLFLLYTGDVIGYVHPCG